MATVILPMGYPLQSGHEFEHLIYQGNVVRVYELPTDPRTDSQLFERRFLSDFGKVRGTAGVYARAALRSSLGAKWGTILYQYAKGDLENCWTAAKAAWNGFTEPGRDAWRAVAPYEATFNDKGMMFFCFLRVASYVVAQYSYNFFGLEEWGEGDAASALAWWSSGLENTVQKGVYSLPEYKSFFGIVGTDTNNANAQGGAYIEGVSTFEFLFFGSAVVFYGRKASGLGSMKTYFDGFEFTTYSLNAGVETWQVELGGAAPYEAEERSFKGLHKVKFEVISSPVNLDWLRVY